MLRAADDAMGIRAFAQRTGARPRVVAGGGLLGLEAAYALHKLGLRVTVLERGDRLLRRQLDARAAELLRAYLEDLGLEILLRRRDRGARGRRPRAEVVLRDGRELPADCSSLVAGIAPDVELAARAGLEVNRGVLVDDAHAHQRPADLRRRRRRRAREGGVPRPVAGRRSSRRRSRPRTRSAATHDVPRPVPVTMLKVVGVELTSVGRFEEQAGDDVIVLEEPRRGAIASSSSRTAGSPARSCSATRPRSPPCAPRSTAASRSAA